MEKRGGALIDIERGKLQSRMRDYFNAELDWNEYEARQTALVQGAARFVAKTARAKATRLESYNDDRLRRYALRPFDTRWCYYTSVRPIWNEPRPALWNQSFSGNTFVIARPAGVAHPEGRPLSYTTSLGDNDYQKGHSYYFPKRYLIAKRRTQTCRRLHEHILRT